MDWLDEDEEGGDDSLVIARRPYRLPVHPKMDKWNDLDFFIRFRMSKATFQFVLQLISPALQYRQPRSRYVTPEEQLLITLRFLAGGEMHLTEIVRVRQQSVNRVLQRVCDAFIEQLHTFIKMPQTNTECQKAAAEFYRIAGFPRTIGAIDCTHVKIRSPGEHLVRLCVLWSVIFALHWINYKTALLILLFCACIAFDRARIIET